MSKRVEVERDALLDAEAAGSVLQQDGGLDGLREELARLRDRQQIVELHDRFAAVMDAAVYDELTSLFTEDAVFEGLAAESWVGAQMISRRMREVGTHHLASQRMMTNYRIALAGDQGRAVVAFRSAHLDEDGGTEPRSHSHEGWYLSDLVRTADGWRFARLKRVNLSDVVITTPDGRAVCEEVYRAASIAPAGDPVPKA